MSRADSLLPTLLMLYRQIFRPGQPTRAALVEALYLPIAEEIIFIEDEAKGYLKQTLCAEPVRISGW